MPSTASACRWPSRLPPPLHRLYLRPPRFFRQPRRVRSSRSRSRPTATLRRPREAMHACMHACMRHMHARMHARMRTHIHMHTYPLATDGPSTVVRLWSLAAGRTSTMAHSTPKRLRCAFGSFHLLRICTFATCTCTCTCMHACRPHTCAYACVQVAFGSFTFQISDDYGDGLCCSSGRGWYEV